MNGDLVKVEFKERNAQQLADALVTQHQSIEQKNINIQGAAVAIALNGSYVAALQTTGQKNKNEQTAGSSAKNAVKEGQGELDGKDKAAQPDAQCKASTASVVQNQYVKQANLSTAYENKKQLLNKEVNFNEQPLSALAPNGDDVPRSSLQVIPIKDQRLKKYVERLKRKVDEEIVIGALNSAEAGGPLNKAADENKTMNDASAPELLPQQNSACCTAVDQRFAAFAGQAQDGRQRNFSLQVAAVAIAIGPGALARARQVVDQLNDNTMNGFASTSIAADLPCCILKNQEGAASAALASNISQQNSSSKFAEISIGLFGGDAEAQQFSNQTNSNSATSAASTSAVSNCGAAPALSAANPDKAAKKEGSKNIKDSSNNRAVSKVMEEKDKAIISINKGILNLRMLVTESGELYLNGAKINAPRLD